jgi:hypothetical protein
MLTPSINTMKTNLNKLSSLSLLAMLGAASCFVVGSASAALIGEWNFDSSTLDNNGTTGATHDGTASGSLSYEAADFSAGFDSGNALNASAGSFSINNSASGDAGYVGTFDGTSFSVSLWMKAPVGANWQIAARKGEDANWKIRQFGAGPSGEVKVDGARDNTFGTAFNDEWHHVVLTVDNGTNATSYWDGNLNKAWAVSYTPATATALLFGEFVGLIDEVKFYDGVLTSTEVTNLNTTNVIPEPGSYALLAGLAGMAFVMARRRI